MPSMLDWIILYFILNLEVQGNTNMEKKKESKRRKEMREESETSKEKEKS